MNADLRGSMAWKPRYRSRRVDVCLRARLDCERRSSGLRALPKKTSIVKIYPLASSTLLGPPKPHSQDGTLDAIYGNFTGGAKHIFEAWLGSREAVRATLATPLYDGLMTSRYRWQSGSVLYLNALNELILSLSALFPPSYLRGGSSAMKHADLSFNLARRALRSVDLRGRALDGAGQNVWQPGKPGWTSPKSVLERRSIADLFTLNLALAAMQQATEEGTARRGPCDLKYLEGLTATQTFYVTYCSHYCGEPGGRRRCNVAMNGSKFGRSSGCLHHEQPIFPGLRICLE
ncbi:hypothetical protein MTO96_048083 [Rhipicephalus appendiculatus]